MSRQEKLQENDRHCFIVEQHFQGIPVRPQVVAVCTTLERAEAACPSGLQWVNEWQQMWEAVGEDGTRYVIREYLLDVNYVTSQRIRV